MATTLTAVSGPAIKRAIEARDAEAFIGFYGDDATIRVVDRNNPPSRPREVKGRAAIRAFWDDMCSRNIAEGDRLAFTQDCTYPDGAKVFGIAVLELAGGRIARHTVVHAWDE
jgi:ketosteroid isomerase-like protein